MTVFTAFDVETRGTEPQFALQPFRARSGHAWLTSVAFADPQPKTFLPKTHSILKPTVAQLRSWLNGCKAGGVTIVGWNVAFDMAWLIALGLRSEVFANRWLDGMLLLRHLNARPLWLEGGPKSYGLKVAVANAWPAEADYADDIDFETDTVEGLTQLAEYNEKDASYTLRLVRRYWAELSPAQRRAAVLEAACLPLVAESMVEGICVDRDAARALSTRLVDTANLAMVKLKLKTREDITDDILASPVKLRKLLFEDWGLSPVKWTPKGAESTDRDALSLLAPDDERAWLLNEYREAKNNRTKFADGAVASLDYNGDGRVRPTPKVFGTYTGRMSYSSKVGKGKDERPTGVALHQWKRDPEFRKVITAPPGYTLLEFDFDGQEYRWMAVKSGDPTMLDLCAPGRDAHQYMADRVGSGVSRQLGKVANLSLQYRTSAKTLVRVARVQYKLQLTLDEAARVHKTYRQTYPRVPRYWKHAINFARINGFAETVAGRRVQLGFGSEWQVGDVWGLESTAINTPIQGSGADQKYLALAVAKDYLPTVDGHFYFELHDGLFFIVPTRKAEQAAHEMKHLLSNLPYKKAWGRDLPVPFPVSAKGGLTWGELEEYR